MPGSERRPEARGRALLFGGAQLALTVLVTWLIVRRVGPSLEDLRALDPAAWTPSWPLLALSCLGLLAGHGLAGMAWARVVLDLGGPQLEGRRAIGVFFVAGLGRYVPGKVWPIAGLALLAGRSGVPAAVSTAAAVLGHAMALAGASAVGVWVLLEGEGGPWRVWFVGALAAGLATLLLPSSRHAALGAWFRLARQERHYVDVDTAAVLRWLGLYLVTWMIYAAAFVLLAMSFGMGGSPLKMGSAFAAAYVLGYAAIFAPAGLGVREGFLMAFLGPSIGTASAGTLAVVARIWTTLLELVPALLFLGSDVGPVDRPS